MAAGKSDELGRRSSRWAWRYAASTSNKPAGGGGLFKRGWGELTRRPCASSLAQSWDLV